MLWALVTRLRDGGYAASEADLRGLLRSGCSAQRVHDVLSGQAGREFADALLVLDAIVGRASG